MLKQSNFDLTDFNSVASDFHLEVFAPKMRQTTIARYTAQISCEIGPFLSAV
jgi:hypothetical protein